MHLNLSDCGRQSPKYAYVLIPESVNIGKRDFCRYDEIQDLGRGEYPGLSSGLNKRSLYKGSWEEGDRRSQVGEKTYKGSRLGDDALEDGRRATSQGMQVTSRAKTQGSMFSSRASTRTQL